MSVLLVAHGSRDPRFAHTVDGICHAVRDALPAQRIELAYLDLTDPLVGHGLGCLARDGDPITVVPLLLGDGYHSRFDLPVLIEAARRRWPAVTITQTPVLGSANLLPALADRARSAGLRPGDGVLLYAVGSSDERSDDAARASGSALARLLDCPVEVVFATKLGPDAIVLRNAVARLQSASATRIVGLPYFLSPGLLTERVEQLLVESTPDCLIAAPLANHLAVVEAIASLASSEVSAILPVGSR